MRCWIWIVAAIAVSVVRDVTCGKKRVQTIMYTDLVQYIGKANTCVPADVSNMTSEQEIPEAVRNIPEQGTILSNYKFYNTSRRPTSLGKCDVTDIAHQSLRKNNWTCFTTTGNSTSRDFNWFFVDCVTGAFVTMRCFTVTDLLQVVLDLCGNKDRGQTCNEFRFNSSGNICWCSKVFRIDKAYHTVESEEVAYTSPWDIAAYLCAGFIVVTFLVTMLIPADKCRPTYKYDKDRPLRVPMQIYEMCGVNYKPMAKKRALTYQHRILGLPGHLTHACNDTTSVGNGNEAWPGHSNGEVPLVTNIEGELATPIGGAKQCEGGSMKSNREVPVISTKLVTPQIRIETVDSADETNHIKNVNLEKGVLTDTDPTKHNGYGFGAYNQGFQIEDEENMETAGPNHDQSLVRKTVLSNNHVANMDDYGMEVNLADCNSFMALPASLGQKVKIQPALDIGILSSNLTLAKSGQHEHGQIADFCIGSNGHGQSAEIFMSDPSRYENMHAPLDPSMITKTFRISSIANRTPVDAKSTPKITRSSKKQQQLCQCVNKRASKRHSIDTAFLQDERFAKIMEDFQSRDFIDCSTIAIRPPKLRLVATIEAYADGRQSFMKELQARFDTTVGTSNMYNPPNTQHTNGYQAARIEVEAGRVPGGHANTKPNIPNCMPAQKSYSAFSIPTYINGHAFEQVSRRRSSTLTICSYCGHMNAGAPTSSSDTGTASQYEDSFDENVAPRRHPRKAGSRKFSLC